MNLSYKAPNGAWSAAIYGKNVTDEEYFSQALNFQNDAPFGIVAGTPARGSEYGVKLGLDF